MIWIGCQCTNHACWLSDANLLWNKINRAWEKLLVFHIHVTETKHLILLIFFIQQYKSVNTMKHHLYKQQKQCIVQSAWRFQITIEKVKSELSWNRSLADWFESSSHFAQVQTFVLHAASPHPLRKFLNVESDYLFITHLYYLMLCSIKRLLFRLCWLGLCWSGLHLVLGWHLS